MVNPPFLKLMQQYEPSGIISTLSQEVFADIKVGRVDSKLSLATHQVNRLVIGLQVGKGEIE